MCVVSQTIARNEIKVAMQRYSLCFFTLTRHTGMQILIVEHFPVVRAGIRQWLSSEPDLSIVGETSSARDGVRMADELRPDVVLLDITAPRRNGYEALLAFKEKWQRLPVLIINSRPERFYTVQLMNSGAAGCFPADGRGDELVRAIRTVACGRLYTGEDEQPPLQPELDGRPRALHEKLNPREYEIFLSVCRGERLTQTADRLSLSLSTVNRYRKQVLAKIGVEDIPGLIRYAVHQGIDSTQY